MFDDEPSTETSLVGDLKRLGIRTGTVMMVHSSLSAIGWVVGGAPTVVRALLSCVGEDGTLVMPAATPECLDPARWSDPEIPAQWHTTLRENLPAFDLETTPTSMGAIPETFRRWPDALRSDHPLSSVCARGAQAEPVIRDHRLGFSEGRGTPFEKLYDLDGWTLLLGVGFDRCTSMHYAESLCEHRRTTTSRFVMRDGDTHVWAEAPDMADDNATLFPVIGREFVDAGLARCGTVGKAPSVLFKTRALVDFAVSRFDQLLGDA